MAHNADIRVRRPDEHDDLISRLTTKEGGPFPGYWQVLVFAAALGWSRGRHDPFEKTGEAIRYGLFGASATVSAVIDSMGVLAHPNDAGIMADDRLPERIKVFEEYANGGLSIIRGELNSGAHVRPMDVILNLCQRGTAHAESMMQDLGLRPPAEPASFKDPDFEP
ncbi:DNA phosphorothioation-associated protein 4 [Actinomadura darangshiensis]|uniref:DNA phosphorothioation-associated protein 4 n=1 Tax=Actinomadura darangshiensis TaxID=705336 RepID=A0A4R5BYL8_9ACTN|nr:DNA phosphorothioation-associated protein 4 [Actinomadura darangshiensis]TDD89524.1 DNA phosphorothioation-associated protein 4 [Actinomadura darangshiensis]